MRNFLNSISELREGELGKIIDRKMEEFKERKTSEKMFEELCFCILTANSNAEKVMEIQKKIGNGFLSFSKKKLVSELKKMGYRFPNKRAEYIIEARKYSNSLNKLIESFEDKNKLREWLVKNVRGLGYKEASHFLRNIGYVNFAILDFHVLNVLSRNRLIKKPKILTERKYLEIENLLKKIAKKLKMSLGELDLYLWYMETGKVLK